MRQISSAATAASALKTAPQMAFSPPSQQSLPLNGLVQSTEIQNGKSRRN
jgi:hypothetical protein